MTTVPGHRICEVRESDLTALEHLLRNSPDVQISLSSLELKEVQPPKHLPSGFNPIPEVALVRLLNTLSSKASVLNEIIIHGANHNRARDFEFLLNRQRAPQATFQHTLVNTLITDIGFPSLSRLSITRYELDTDILKCTSQLARFLDRLRSIHVATGYDKTLTGGGGVSSSYQITRLPFPAMLTKNNLRELSLHTIMPIFGPANDLYTCHFPNLQSLSLKGFVAGRGPKSLADFIVTHKSTLQSLELINCPICVSSTWEDDPPTFTPVLYQMAELFDVIRVELQALRSFHISEDISAPWNFQELKKVNDAHGNLWNAKRSYMRYTVWIAEWIIENFSSAPYRADFERDDAAYVKLVRAVEARSL